MVERHFAEAGLTPVSVSVRSFPGEIIAIVEVDSNFERALSLAEEVGEKIENGFVTVRQVGKKKDRRRLLGPVKNVHDERVPALIELMNARSRTSEHQPSLRYIQDAEERLKLAISPRHHLVFGRRGVGKTSLLLEAKRTLEQDGNHVLWINMHSLRGLRVKDVFYTVASRLCDLALGALRDPSAATARLLTSTQLAIEQQRELTSYAEKKPAILVPKLQQAVARFCMETGQSLFIFLDDVHYLPSPNVPQLLDWLHGITRDNAAWLKVAGIQHQTRWFIPNPPTGLQTGHDAAIINLDITLEHPEKAKRFLQNVLKTYVEESDATPYSHILSGSAVDRLVLASGGVPRDFLTLCASSMQTARQRTNARTVGVQDVNNAAGIAAQTKLQELEDDAASAEGKSQTLIATLNCVREFLLTEQQITFLRIDFRDKESQAGEYRLLQALADLRMLHLINASLSDPHQAGHRSEVYLLDLSQYSGYRLKQKLTVLDFEHGHMVLKRTRSAEPAKVGDTVLKLVAFLRRGPIFELKKLSEMGMENE
jgi:Cdc6-like AAA superfamily ATPase